MNLISITVIIAISTAIAMTGLKWAHIRFMIHRDESKHKWRQQLKKSQYDITEIGKDSHPSLFLGQKMWTYDKYGNKPNEGTIVDLSQKVQVNFLVEGPSLTRLWIQESTLERTLHTMPEATIVLCKKIYYFLYLVENADSTRDWYNDMGLPYIDCTYT